MMTATEFWKHEFGEEPKSIKEKLACAMMHKYAEYYYINNILKGRFTCRVPELKNLKNLKNPE